MLEARLNVQLFDFQDLVLLSLFAFVSFKCYQKPLNNEITSDQVRVEHSSLNDYNCK